MVSAMALEPVEPVRIHTHDLAMSHGLGKAAQALLWVQLSVCVGRVCRLAGSGGGSTQTSIPATGVGFHPCDANEA